MSGANAVKEDRLWQRHADMAKLGGTPKGGVNRQALSPEDAAARNQLAAMGKDRAVLTVFTDTIGNLFIRKDGTDSASAPVLSGSHMDSQPTGGRFDGMYGVLAAFEALEALEDAGVKTKRPVMAVAWTNEEGSRFQPGAMGSAVFAGAYKLDEMLGQKDWKGVVLKDALAETLKAAPAPVREGAPGFAVDSYVEAHIEQGPRLENERKTIGVVTAIQGSRRYIVTIDGEEAHAGTTPRAARKDAYAAATRLAAALYEATADTDDTLRFTIGRVEVSPGSPNTVPGKVTFTIDMRHPDDAVLVEREAAIERLLVEKTKPCSASLQKVTNVPPTNFDPAVIDLVRAKASGLGLSNMDMPSGAGHDAMHIAKLCPTGMIFVPCERGISHNEIENATPADLAAGTRVLVEVLEALANR